MAAISSSTMASRPTALAAAAGYCISPIWLLIMSPTEALCPPLISRTVAKSPITSTTTKMLPMPMPGLVSGRMTHHSVCQKPAPASRAASSSRRSMRSMVLKTGTTMNSV
jgi:hypothetical protein